MSQLYENALLSIRMGIEDLQSGEPGRLLSATRNYYSGLLLLAKEVLVNSVPNADPKEIIGVKFKPVPDGEGGVAYEVDGNNTIDFQGIKTRFRDFGLPWPKVDIVYLQKLRNSIEHYYLDEPEKNLRSAIGVSFSMLVELFNLIGKAPESEIESVWAIILQEKEVFDKIQLECIDSFSNIEWPIDVDLTLLKCEACGSSLICNRNPECKLPDEVEIKCRSCSNEWGLDDSINLIAESNYGVHPYILASDGGEDPIKDCPHCYTSTYIASRGVCLKCGESFEGECARCGMHIGVDEYDLSGLCGYCDHMQEKIMRE